MRPVQAPSRGHRPACLHDSVGRRQNSRVVSRAAQALEKTTLQVVVSVNWPTFLLCVGLRGVLAILFGASALVVAVLPLPWPPQLEQPGRGYLAHHIQVRPG
jgi:hypothetical protein